MKQIIITTAIIIASLVFISPAIQAQTTAFSYQGRLTSNANAANGTYDFQFTLFSALTAGTQVGTLSKTNVTVTGGVFTVTLDFGAAAFPGADRWLEISAKKSTDSTFTLLTPRQQIGPNPYSIRAQSAANADTATNATQLGGVAASQYVTTTNGPTNFVQNQSAAPQSANFNISGNGSIGGNLTVTGTLNATLPAGSGNYIQNTTTQQTSSNFNISGDGVLGGTLTANIISATTKYNIGSNRVIGLADRSIFVGVGAGSAITTANLNTFLGFNAGLQTADGSGNTFLGFQSGKSNTSGFSNVFVGNGAGGGGNGNNNTFMGAVAGFNSGGSNNAFFGSTAGFFNTSGINNTFIGANSASTGTGGNITGSNNTFIGANSGLSNTIEGNNTFVGANSNGVSGIANATAIGSGSQVTVTNGLVLGNLNSKVGIGTTAPNFKLHIVDNAVPSIRVDNSNNVGTWLQLNNTSTGGHNWGILSSGSGNGEGAGNLVIIDETGGGHVEIDNPLIVDAAINTTSQYNINSNRVLGVGGTNNTFVGVSAGAANTGTSNVFMGTNAGQKNTGGANNTFIGSGAGANNLTGLANTAVGSAAGSANLAAQNTFIGASAGQNNTSGLQNVFLGASSGASNTGENGNTFLGFNTNAAAGIVNSTAIGANAKVTRSNSIVLGSLTDFNGNTTDTFVGIGTTSPLTKLHVVETDSSNFRTLRLEGSSTTGVWSELVNTSTGGHTWAIISAGTSNGEGAGNLVFTDETSGGKVVMNAPLQVPSCTGCTTVTSDRNAKSNFAAIDGRSVLEKLVGIPIQTWNYNDDKTRQRHIGPMAQDFRAAFGLGEDDRHINLIDENGIALAAIQELYRVDQAKDKEIADLKAANAEMAKRLEALEKVVEKLAKQNP